MQRAIWWCSYCAKRLHEPWHATHYYTVACSRHCMKHGMHHVCRGERWHTLRQSCVSLRRGIFAYMAPSCVHLQRGTWAYIAPELCGYYEGGTGSSGAGKVPVTQAVDVYSYGVLMWEVLSGERPQRSSGSLRKLRQTHFNFTYLYTHDTYSMLPMISTHDMYP